MFGKKVGYDIFLGGTTNKSTWREDFIEAIKKKNSKIKCFNPVVDNWTPECIELENFVKFHSKYHIYVLTPRMQGVYSIAEMVDSVHNNTKKVFVYIQDFDTGDNGKTIGWDLKMKNSLNAVSNLVMSHGGIIVNSFEDLINKIVEDYNSSPVARSINNN